MQVVTQFWRYLQVCAPQNQSSRVYGTPIPPVSVSYLCLTKDSGKLLLTNSNFTLVMG